MQVWLGTDGRLRGVVSLDAITPEEFAEAFRRWCCPNYARRVLVR
jgi:hypothetical protein